MRIILLLYCVVDVHIITRVNEQNKSLILFTTAATHYTFYEHLLADYINMHVHNNVMNCNNNLILVLKRVQTYAVYMHTSLA